jgi:hypothetical protein
MHPPLIQNLGGYTETLSLHCYHTILNATKSHRFSLVTSLEPRSFVPLLGGLFIKGETADGDFSDYYWIFWILKSPQYFVFSRFCCGSERTSIIATSFLSLKARFDSAFRQKKVNMRCLALLKNYLLE